MESFSLCVCACVIKTLCFLHAGQIQIKSAMCRNASPGVERRSPDGENLRRGARARGAAV